MSNIDDDKTDPQATLYDEKAEEPSLLDDLRATFAKIGVKAPQAERTEEADGPASGSTGGSFTLLQMLCIMVGFSLVAVIAIGYIGKARDAALEQQKIESSQIEQP